MTIGYEIKRDPTINWIIGPVGRCVEFLAEETMIASVLHRAASALPTLPTLLAVAANSAEKAGLSGAPFKAGLAQTQGLEDWARKIEANDYTLVNRHALVAIWGSFEAALEDTIVLVLMNDSRAVKEVQRHLRKVRVNQEGLLLEEEARRVYRSLERLARQKRTDLEGALDWILDLFDISRIPGTSYAVALQEANALRNSLLHRQGRLDARAIAEAPSLGAESGHQILVDSKAYQKYYDAIGGFVQELITGICKSRYIRSRAELEQAGANSE